MIMVNKFFNLILMLLFVSAVSSIAIDTEKNARGADNIFPEYTFYPNITPTWRGRIFEGGPEVELNASVESIHKQIYRLNPGFHMLRLAAGKPSAINPSSTPMSAGFQEKKAPETGNHGDLLVANRPWMSYLPPKTNPNDVLLKCGVKNNGNKNNWDYRKRWPFAPKAALPSLVYELESMGNGTVMAPVAAKTCTHIMCKNYATAWLCNDNEDKKVVKIEYSVLAEIVRAIWVTPRCEDVVGDLDVPPDLRAGGRYYLGVKGQYFIEDQKINVIVMGDGVSCDLYPDQ